MHNPQINLEKQDSLSLAQVLQELLDEKDEKRLLIGELTDTIGGKSFGLLLIILSLPSAIPVPAVGYSTPFGICSAIIAIQMLIGRKKAALPKWIKKIHLPLKITQTMSRFALGFLKRAETIIKPRYSWIHTRLGHSLLSIAILVMAGFMMIPLPGTNTLPAMAIFVIGISICEEDGLVAIAAMLISIAALFFSGFLVWEVGRLIAH